MFILLLVYLTDGATLTEPAGIRAKFHYDFCHCEKVVTVTNNLTRNAPAGCECRRTLVSQHVSQIGLQFTYNQRSLALFRMELNLDYWASDFMS